jgi:hypothetical protein
MDKEQLTGVFRIFVPSVLAWFSARGLIATDLVGPATDMVINTLVGVILLGAMVWSFIANSKTAQIAKVADMPEIKKVVATAEIAEGTLKDHDKVTAR